MSNRIARMTLGAGAAVLCLGTGSAALAQGGCAAPAGWTSHDAVPAPDNGTEPMNNCAFHLWSWNTFLWMTQPGASGAPRFLAFATPQEVFSPDTGAMKYAALPQEKRLLLTPRSTKSSSMEDLDSIFQAGSNGVLIHSTQDGATAGRAVYYSQNVNSTFYEFVRSNGYHDAKTYLDAPDDTNFAVGSMEFKYSWKIVGEGADVSGFYTTEADIRMLSEAPDGTVVADPDKIETVLVALVGVQVVGVVENHPEFIWATFEHIGNAPDLPEGLSPGSSEPVSDRDFTFYAAGTPAVDGNVTNGGSVKLVDASAQLVTPVTNAYRRYPWGGGDAANTANIQSLNASVLGGTLKDDPVWSNYQLIGAVWGPSSATVPLRPNTLVQSVGSTRLSNVTMETFTQSGANCFSCHSTFQSVKHGVTLPGKNMNVSHIMTNGFFAQRKAQAKATYSGQ